MKFGKYMLLQLMFALCSSFAIGLLLGILVLATGGVDGNITMELDISRSDILWIVLGFPLSLAVLFLIFTPLSFLLYTAIARLWTAYTSNQP